MISNSLDILVPNLPESVVDATVAIWHKKEGDKVQENEILLEIETDKIMLEIPATKTGILEVILEQEGSVVISGQILGRLKCIDNVDDKLNLDQGSINKNFEQTQIHKNIEPVHLQKENNNISDILISPSNRKLIAEHNLDIKNIRGTGSKGRITRTDIELYLQNQLSELHNNIQSDPNKYLINDKAEDHHCYTKKDIAIIGMKQSTNHRKDTRVTMNRLRKTISQRLLNVTNSTAMLTTFNEVNMKAVVTLRNEYKELFEKRHNIKLGFLSFYVKAVLEGLRRFPTINATIDGDEIVYHNYFDISIAVSTERGLVTPVLKDVDTLSITDIEINIKSLAKKGRDGKLTIEELKGGNFTITNGGIFGSLMSTPIINPPQSAILGIHVIKDRPMVVNNQIVILPMMYLALSYDHRLIDGKDSVSFLITIKELIEDPYRLLLDV